MPIAIVRVLHKSLTVLLSLSQDRVYTAALQRKYSANWRMRSLSIYDQIWIFHIFGYNFFK